MYNSLFLPAYAISRMSAGPIGPYLASYLAFLQQQKYSTETIKCYIRAACGFSRWLDNKQIQLAQVSDNILEEYRAEFRRKTRHSSLPTKASGLTKLLVWMRIQGLVSSPPRPAAAGPHQWRANFEHHLASVHGVSQATRSKYVRCSIRFVDTVLGSGAPDWAALTPEHIRGFVIKDAPQHNTCDTVCALRALLRFLATESVVSPGLISAVPPLRRRRLAGVPCHLREEDVRRVIATCDNRSHAGIRDKMIIILLSRMGLRAGEVVRISLDDIDWTSGRLLVRSGKTRRERVLPIPKDVGHCIARYLKHARPSSIARTLLLRLRAPYTPISPYTVSWIAACRLRQAGVNAARFGSHVFRHTAATHMVRRGASLKDIADVLGHQHLGTTNIYAKLDLSNLAKVALPWPGGER